MASEVQRNLLGKNEEYARSYTQGNLPIQPAKKFAVVTCMDSRLDPNEAYGLSLGEANVIRNAGGSARDALRSLVISGHLLGTREILVVKHTKCGLLGATNEFARSAIGQNLGEDQDVVDELKKIDFMPIESLEKAAKDDVDFLRDNKLILNEVRVSGWIHDIDTGRVNKVVE